MDWTSRCPDVSKSMCRPINIGVNDYIRAYTSEVRISCIGLYGYIYIRVYIGTYVFVCISSYMFFMLLLVYLFFIVLDSILILFYMGVYLWLSLFCFGLLFIF